MLSSDLNSLHGSKCSQPLQERVAIQDLDFTDEEIETPCLIVGDSKKSETLLV